MPFLKKNQLKLVPWMSFKEWENVYKQVFSNNSEEQRKSYETLLVWKARTPILPTGIECTLELLEVCLRDKEWSEKIENAEMPIHHENDIKRMYSTAVMRFLNHICSINQMRPDSIFKKCLKMNIPSWIVDLRHDVAHSQELPPLTLLRNAANFLFAWLHNEYWISQHKFMKRSKRDIWDCSEDPRIEYFANIIEVWIAAGLYKIAGHKLVTDIPNNDLITSLHTILGIPVKKETDNNVEEKKKAKKARQKQHSLKKMELNVAQLRLLEKLTKILNKSSKCHQNYNRVICNIILEKEAFLPTSEFLQIFTDEQPEDLKEFPVKFLELWQNLIVFLQEKKILQILFLYLLDIVQNDNINKTRRLMASLWIKTLMQATIRQWYARKVALLLDQVLDFSGKDISKNAYTSKIENQLLKHHPEFADVLRLNYTVDILDCLKSEAFLREMLLNSNECAVIYIPYVLDLMKDLKEEQKNEIMEIVDIFTTGKNEKDSFDGKIYRVEDLDISENEEIEKEEDCEDIIIIRNTTWKLGEENDNWKNYPIGILPWSKGMKRATNSTAVPAVVVRLKDNKVMSPGFVDRSQKLTESQVQWRKVLQKRDECKRKFNQSDIDINEVTKCIKKD